MKCLTLGGRPVLGEIKLTLGPSETLALLGPSGVGKTSLLQIITGLQGAYEGHCHVHGRIGTVFQEPRLLPWRSVRDNLCITTGITPDQAMQALAEVGLAERHADFPEQLSLGQQRRLSLSRAFAVKPDVLLMDEPFVSLDPGLVEEMMTLFTTLRATYRVAAILVTHAKEEAERLADRTITLGGVPAQITSDVPNV
ncbi:MAG: ATP-binding cassette domain-containing protein [Sulfitobacter sp.]